MSTFYVTTPIYYVNGSPHLGHAYTAIAADMIARFHRLDGEQVLFLTGTDEHGQKVEKAARDAGVSPNDFADEVSGRFRRMVEAMGVSNDVFIRTTEARHREAASALWRMLAASGDIYLGSYEGWYAVRDEDFHAEADLRTLADGTRVAPTGAPVEWVREPNYLFRLSAYQERLLAYYEAHPEFLGPHSRRNEVLSFVRGGLTDLSVSRTSFSWGIPVPDDAEHVMYVWLDALANYLTAVGWPDETGALAAFWPADLHIVGKDILRFHAVYWPAFLMAAGLPLPRRVFSHGWWTSEGEKMSKSVGNVVDPFALVETFGLDPVRFFLLREITFGADGDFSRKSLILRLNGELANDLGNLAQRSLSLIAKNLGGVLPEPVTAPSEDDRGLLASVVLLTTLMRGQVERQGLNEAIEEVWRVVRAANAYIDRQAPWALRRTDFARMSVVLRVLVDVIRGVATMLQPVMPGSMAAMLDQLGVPAEARDFASLAMPLAGGLRLPAPTGVFPRWVEPDGAGT